MATTVSLPPTPFFTRPTPILSTSSTTLPTPLATTPTTLLPLPSSPSSSGPPDGSATTLLTRMIATGPNDLVQSAGTTTDPPGMLIASTTGMAGIFGVGSNLDPLIIFALVLGGLVLLLILGALIYCCCVCCGVTSRRDYLPHMRRTDSLRSINIIQEPYRSPPAKPLFLRASIGPDQCSTCGAEPAASVLLDQPIRVNVGAYAVGDGTCGTLATRRVIGTYPKRVRQGTVRPNVIVTRRPVVQTVRKKYLYPVDSIGVSDGMTYNTVTPNVITTLGDGYVTGRSIRSTGNRFSNGGLFFYDD